MNAIGWQRSLSFLVWVLVGLSAAFWGLRLGDSHSSGSEPAPPAKLTGVDPAAVVAALGGVAASPAANPAAPAKRIELLGVIAEGRRGVALLSLDGQPGKPYQVGASLDDGLALKAVGQRHAELAQTAAGPTTQRLELPPAAPVDLPAGLKLLQSAKP